jgi:hypothetical protein
LTVSLGVTVRSTLSLRQADRARVSATPATTPTNRDTLVFATRSS